MIPVNIKLCEKETANIYWAVALRIFREEEEFYVAQYGDGNWAWRKTNDFWLSNR